MNGLNHDIAAAFQADTICAFVMGGCEPVTSHDGSKCPGLKLFGNVKTDFGDDRKSLTVCAAGVPPAIGMTFVLAFEAILLPFFPSAFARQTLDYSSSLFSYGKAWPAFSFCTGRFEYVGQKPRHYQISLVPATTGNIPLSGGG